MGFFKMLGIGVAERSGLIVPVIAILFFIPGLVYGLITRSIKNDKDVANQMTKTMAAMGMFIVLAFTAGQFVAYFADPTSVWSSASMVQSFLKMGNDGADIRADHDAARIFSGADDHGIPCSGFIHEHHYAADDILCDHHRLCPALISVMVLLKKKRMTSSAREKTALKLLKNHGSVEEVLEHLDEVKGKKLKENLTAHKEDALMSNCR